MKTTMDAAGRLVIPKPIRSAAGLKAGMELEIECRDGKIEIEPAHIPVRLVRKGSVLVAHAAEAPALTQKEVNSVLRDVRERRR